MIVDQPIAPENSTVLGQTYKQAPYLWEQLDWSGRVFWDSVRLEEEVSYRVRPRWTGGMWFPKPRRRVREVYVFQFRRKWHWRFVLEGEARRRTGNENDGL